MSAPPSRDWLDHDPAPSFVGAVVVVRSNSRLTFRAILPTGVPGAAMVVAGPLAGAGLGVVTAGLLLISFGVARTLWWWYRFAARELIATETHLGLSSRGAVEQWVAWADIEGLVVVPSDRTPEWSRTQVQWFHVCPFPPTAVVPPQAILTGFHDMLISKPGSASAAEAIRSAAQARGVAFEIDL